MADKIKKVYVNPNFNRSVNNGNVNPISQACMHINPNFKKSAQTNKVYINPNFLISNINRNLFSSLHDIVPYNNNELDLGNSYTTYMKASLIEKVPVKLTHDSYDFDLNDIYTNQNTVPLKQEKLPLQLPIRKSRYCIVRKTGENVSQKQSIAPQITVKVNRYKTVTMSNYIKSLNLAHEYATQKEHQFSSVRSKKCKAYKNTSTSVIVPESKGSYNSKYKICKKTSCSTNIATNKLNQKSVSTSRRLNHSKLKAIRNCLKKNNIPCPLFQKYGKCLRRINGKCEFLHDKKQVSICKQFLKGVCLRKFCLLSHEVTAEKMPTCYFYLKGICTKDDCQYLHVKLNDKSKICPDFIKGYCVKGSSCLNRHVHARSAKKADSKIKVTKTSKTTKRKSTDLSVAKLKPIASKAAANNIKSGNVEKHNIEKIHCEQRYYKDNTNDSDLNDIREVIKPSRCKLGTLPSFIKL